MKQFVTHYANWKITEIEKALIPEEDKDELIRRIDRAVHYCEQGIVTIDETMRTIAEVRNG